MLSFGLLRTKSIALWNKIQQVSSSKIILKTAFVTWRPFFRSQYVNTYWLSCAIRFRNNSSLSVDAYLIVTLSFYSLAMALDIDRIIPKDADLGPYDVIVVAMATYVMTISSSHVMAPNFLFPHVDHRCEIPPLGEWCHFISLQWRLERVDCMFNSLFMLNPPVSSGFPSQSASNVDIVSISRWHLGAESI